MRRDLESHKHQIHNLIIHKNIILLAWRTTSVLALIMQSARNASNSRSLAERRLEDVAARQHFEVGVHGDRLLNPSSANPGMAAGRAGGRSDRRRNGTRLRAAPLRLELPIEDVSVGNEAFMSRTSQHIGTVLLMPIQHALSEDMRAWAAREGLMERSTWLPALLKPYLRLPLDRVSVKVRTSSFEPSFAGILGPARPFLLLVIMLCFRFIILIVDESVAPTNAFLFVMNYRTFHFCLPRPLVVLQVSWRNICMPADISKDHDSLYRRQKNPVRCMGCWACVLCIQRWCTIVPANRAVWVGLEFNKSSAFYGFKNHANILKGLMWRCAFTSVPQASLKQGTDKQ
jgi:hypothetical protein